jgi:RNA polymerase sigma-70 factor (ECF subfamily)
VTAGNVIRNRRRADVRRSTLASNLVHLHEADTAGVDEVVAERAHLLAALERLSGLEREALLLVAWDGLDPRGAAEVARCAPRAFRARLSRARARLAAELDAALVATTPVLPSKEALS